VADHGKAAKAWELYAELWKLLVEPIQFPLTKELPPLDMRKERARHVLQDYFKFLVNATIYHDAK
jgi:hypothetical protein